MDISKSVLDKRRSAYSCARGKELEGMVSCLDKAFEVFRKDYETISFSGVEPIPFDTIRKDLESIEGFNQNHA